MRLKTKLVLAATGSTFAIVIVLSLLSLGELLRQRIAQTADNNDAIARQVLLMTKQAVQQGFEENPPGDISAATLGAAVVRALRDSDALDASMMGFVRYSPAVQDISVTDDRGVTLVSTDPQGWDQAAPGRKSFDRLRDGSPWFQMRQVFGRAQVLDVAAPLDRNGVTFLVVHVGVRSSFLKNNYAPRLWDAFLIALVAGVFSILAAGVLTSLALRPIEEISARLEGLALAEGGAGAGSAEDGGRGLAPGEKADAVVRVTHTIERLGQQIRSAEAGYTDLRQSLDQVLDTLREGIVLFTAERRAAMVSDAVANFVGDAAAGPLTRSMVGKSLREIFVPESDLGRAVHQAFERGGPVAAERVRMEDGRDVEITLDRIEDERVGGGMGTLLTLRDAGSAMRLEQELEVSRRLAAVGRLTAGVGHEVKNPINAMVVHLELLKAKLEAAGDQRGLLPGAMRHVEILAGEMERLDRVVQALADFTRPMELRVVELDLRDLVDSVVELTGAEMAEHGVEVRCALHAVKVRGDGELLRQALLNLMLNGMQAMEDGGVLRVEVRREGEAAVIEVADEGAGIAPEVVPHIFELYFSTKPRGSGIGLSTTYRIVQMHGGAVEVSSGGGAGSGAVFTVRLPAAVAETRAGRVLAGRAA